MTSVPPSTDTIADLPVRDTIACRNHVPDNLMAWYTRTMFQEVSPGNSKYPCFNEMMKRGNAQFTGHAMSLRGGVGETNTACLHLHQNLTGIWQDQLNFLDRQWGTGLLEGSLFVMSWKSHRRSPSMSIFVCPVRGDGEEGTGGWEEKKIERRGADNGWPFIRGSSQHRWLRLD